MKKYQIFFNCLAVVALVLSIIDFTKIQGLKRKYRLVPRKKIDMATKVEDHYTIWSNLLQKYPVTEKKPLVVVITSYNNETVCEKNLQSVFEQTYDNYRIIYIDDCSTDHTLEKVKNCIQKYNQEQRTTLIHNPTRKLKLANVYQAYTMCKDEEIIVNIDGDDWLAHGDVFTLINEYYQNPDVWMTYGSSITHPTYEKKIGSPLPDKALLNNKIRDEPFQISMLRTFYAGLFKKVKLKDLFYKGNFLANTEDRSYMYPMLEMAPTHALCIPEVLYIINENNPIRDNKVTPSLQNALSEYLAKKQPYQPLPTTFTPTNSLNFSVTIPPDLVIFSNNTPDLLASSIENYQKFLFPINQIHVFFTALDSKTWEQYQRLKKHYSDILFIESDNTISADLEKLCLLSDKRSSPYLLLATEESLLKGSINTLEYIKELEYTGAMSGFLHHSSSLPVAVALKDKITAVTLANLTKYETIHNRAFFAFFHKKFLQEILTTMSQSQPFPLFKEEFINKICLSSPFSDELSLLYTID